MQQFTAGAAHELRTPLAVLQAAIESTLPTQVLPALEAREPQRIVERQINRLSQLVNDLLLLCRMDQQVLPVQKQPCCLNDLISDLVEEFEELASSALVKLTKDIKGHQPIFVRGDLEQLYRLVSNLIDNAIQYTPAGSQVTVSLDRGQDHALIQVQDTGVGIALPEQTRIFERFYRVSSDRSRSTGGSGLGLAIAQAIVRSHHGSLQLRSELGKGSIFTIRLPL
ncbi:MAG: GHKL domain-containing protein [Chroococcidiopsidaceae cyanobacterium CP_BM_RX_35]|nr:GHKL domain-containing protein [Chroococcidiopsidaceae cyanobacterium CP_BM_RX_35]